MQKIPVYVISLKNALSRRALIAKNLNDLEIEYQIITATRGDEVDLGLRKEMNPSGNMSPGALGCYISHTTIYERMIAEKIPVALILEDDTVLHYNVKNLVSKGLKSLSFDYCFLGCDDRGDEGFIYYDQSKPINITDQHTAYPLSAGPFCTNAYLITNEGAKKRMACVFPAAAPIDHYHYLPYRPRFIAIIRMVASVNEESAIGSMSSVNWSEMQKKIRKYWWYYPIRDVLKLNYIKKLIALRNTKFTHPGLWRPYDSAVKVVRKKLYQRSDILINK
jgi:glycosyl transferase family 25